MHELSVCQALVDQLRDLATRESAQRITRVLLRVGPLSGVVPDLLAHAFPIAAAETIAEGAALAIEDARVRVRCRTCGAETDAEPGSLVCGGCGDFRTDLVSGDELLLVSVELER
jgi:hydrogenase nickel incorporation protein HypA/HybF